MPNIDNFPNFNGSSGADLTTLTSARGNRCVPWSPIGATATHLLDGAGGTYPQPGNPFGYSFFYLDTAPPGTDYSVTAVVDEHGSDPATASGPAIIDPAGGTYLAGEWFLPGNIWFITDNGNTVGTSAATTFPGSPPTVELIRSQGQATLKVNGTVVVGPVAITTATGAGFGGYYHQVGPGGLTPTTGIHPTGLSVDSLAGTLAVNAPAPHQTFQRSGPGSGSADVPVSGTFGVGGTPPANILYSLDGGALTRLAAVSGDTFSGAIPGVPAGVHSISVCFDNDHTTIATVNNVAVGDVYLCAGQSNMEGEGTAYQPVYALDTGATAAEYRGAAWGVLADPSGGGGGSILPWVANLLRDPSFFGVPVAFVPTAAFGSAVASWRPGQANLVNALAAAAAAGTGGFRAVLWLQGETDAVNSVTGASWKASMDATAGAFVAALSCPVMVAVLPTFPSFSAPSGTLPDIQAAQRRCVGGPLYTAYQPDLSTIETAPDAIHLLSDDRLFAAGLRFAAALARASGAFGGGLFANSLDGGFQ